MAQELSSRQIKAALNYLSAPSVDEACKKSNIARSTFYKWMQDENFSSFLAQKREEITREALSRLKDSLVGAVSKLVSLVNSDNEQIARLSSKDIIDYVLKTIELEKIEQRMVKIEEALQTKGCRV